MLFSYEVGSVVAGQDVRDTDDVERHGRCRQQRILSPCGRRSRPDGFVVLHLMLVGDVTCIPNERSEFLMPLMCSTAVLSAMNSAE